MFVNTMKSIVYLFVLVYIFFQSIYYFEVINKFYIIFQRQINCEANKFQKPYNFDATSK